jgi:hypothetical protein
MRKLPMLNSWSDHDPFDGQEKPLTGGLVSKPDPQTPPAVAIFANGKSWDITGTLSIEQNGNELKLVLAASAK